jgi:hypothetical protein
MAIYNTYFSVLGLQDSLGVLPNLGVLPGLGRLDDLGEYAFSPTSLFLNGEQGVWYDPSDLTPEKVSWRRNLLTYSQDFENAAWTKSNASILSNLALYSQDFDNAYWLKARASITANTSVAPDGTTTADTLVEDTTNNSHPLYVTGYTATANPYTASVYVKASGRNKVRIQFAGTAFAGSPYANYDLVAVTATTFSGATSATITDAGNGWYRCVLTATATAGSADLYFQPLDAANSASYTGSGAASLLFWGAQLVPGSTAQTYTRSLATAAPIQFADPLGGTLADKLVENTATSTHRLVTASTITVSSGATVTNSVFVKAAERTWAVLSDGGSSGVSTIYFNLANGTFGTVGVGVTQYSATNLGSGWYRIQYTCVLAGAVSQPFIGVASADNTNSYTGDGVSGIYVYGAQVEQASTASAYQRITDFSSDFLAAFPTHALYQESTGTTPVTALGQSVGYVVDKRLGGMTALGPNLVTNGTFSNGTTGWTLAPNATVTVEPSFAGKTNVVRTVNNTSSGVTTSQTITGLTAGRSYLVTFDAYAPSPNLLVNVGACYVTETASLRVTPTGEDAWQSRQFIFTASGTSTTLSFNAGTSGAGSVQTGDQALLGNFTLREVPGNHAIQATSASRPTLQARSNLLTYSEQFDNAAWTKDGATISANATTAPDGTLTADKIVESATTGLHWLYGSSVLSATTQTCSIYAKANERGRIAFGNGSADHYATFNLVNGTVISAGTGTVSGGTITEVGNGWYRCSCIITLTSVATLAVFVMNDSNQRNYAGDGSSGLFLWGIQRELGSTATTYQRVTTATDYADVGLPRNLTFDGIDDSLATAGNVDFATWTVGTRRNLLTVPTMFDDAGWSKTRASVTANSTTAPDGTTTADTLVEDTTATNSHLTFNSTILTVSNATAYTYSIYAKPAGRTWLFLAPSFSSASAYFDVQNGALGTVANGTASIVAVGNGWYRCSLAFTSTSTSGYVFTQLASANGTVNYTGDGTSGLFLWGAQLEVGSTATAFQDVGTDKVTLFSGVTKLSDAATGIVSELSINVGSNNGTFVLAAPSSSGTNSYRYTSKGTVESFAGSGVFASAPDTSVLTGTGNIGADIVQLRRNAIVVETSNTDQGTGTYGSYLLYVGRRASSSLPFNGRLFQLVIRGEATDSVTVGNAERWVGQLTGVAL